MLLNALLRDLIQTHRAAIWVETTDSIGVQLELNLLSNELPITFVSWDVVRGAAIPHLPDPCDGDPVAAAGLGLRHRIAGRSTVLLLLNFHWYLQRIDVIQALLNAVANARATPTTIVIAAPRVPLPPELELHFEFIQPGLPEAREIREIARPLLEGIDSDGQQSALLEGIAGLNYLELQTLIDQVGSAQPASRRQAILDRRAGILERHTLLRQQHSTDTLARIYGMPALVEQSLALLPRNRPSVCRGLFLLGPSGCGKTAFALALGNELRRPVFSLDWRNLENGALSPEKVLRESFRRLEALEPAILLLEGLSAALARLCSVVGNISMARIWDVFFEWMTTHRADVFTITIGNAVGSGPLELIHPERLSAMYFVDLPDAEVRSRLWDEFRDEFDISPTEQAPDSTGWTGGEIRSCCRRAAHQGCSLQDAAASMVPASVISAEQLESLRVWASGRTRSVETTSWYQHLPQWAPRRFIDPTMN